MLCPLDLFRRALSSNGFFPAAFIRALRELTFLDYQLNFSEQGSRLYLLTIINSLINNNTAI